PVEVDHDHLVAERLGDGAGDRAQHVRKRLLVAHDTGHVQKAAQPREGIEIVGSHAVGVPRLNLLRFVGNMVTRLEWTLPLLAMLAVAATGCGGADPSVVALPEAARALGVAPDFAGTIWETTG